MRGHPTFTLACGLILCGLATTPWHAAAQSPTITHIASIPGPFDLIQVRGAMAYVAAEKTLTVLDVSDPRSPKRLGAYTFPQRINGFRPAGRLIYVAADRFGLGIIEVSGDGTPMLRGSLQTPGQAKNVSVSGTRVLVADVLSGLDVVDVSNPASPVLVGSIFLDGVATDVSSAGTLAVAADRPTGFHVVDPTKTGDIQPIASVQSTIPSAFQAQLEVLSASTGSPHTAIVATSGLLQLFDISNPAAPVALKPYRTPGQAGRLSVSGSLAYVLDDRAGLQVVDLSLPSSPRIVGAYQVPGRARDVSVAGSSVFVVDGNGDVMILQQAK